MDDGLDGWDDLVSRMLQRDVFVYFVRGYLFTVVSALKLKTDLSFNLTYPI